MVDTWCYQWQPIHHPLFIPSLITVVEECVKLFIPRTGGEDLGRSAYNKNAFLPWTESSGNSDLHQHPAADHPDCSSSVHHCWWDQGGKKGKQTSLGGSHTWTLSSHPWGGLVDFGRSPGTSSGSDHEGSHSHCCVWSLFWGKWGYLDIRGHKLCLWSFSLGSSHLFSLVYFVRNW